MPDGCILCITLGQTVQAEDRPLSAERDQLYHFLFSRLKANRRAGRNIKPKTKGCGPRKTQRAIGFEEVIMRTHLNRSVSGIEHRDGSHGSSSV